MMSANAPMMIQEAVVHGRPEAGILPSGQVAGLIDDLPSVENLISGIIKEASATAARVGRVTFADAKSGSGAPDSGSSSK